MSTTPNRGARFDRFPRGIVTEDHGAHFDEFTRQPTSPHGPQYDAGFNRDPQDVEFNRQLANVPAEIRTLPAGCPSCGNHHTLEDALRFGRPAATGKTVDVMADVRKSERLDTEVGPADDADLHSALVDSIQKTYGRRADLPVVERTRAARASVIKSTNGDDLHHALVGVIGKMYGFSGRPDQGRRPAGSLGRGVAALREAASEVDVQKSRRGR